jgi:hypothetical protein
LTPRATPATRYAARIAAALQRTAEGDQSHLTLSGLIVLLGPRAHRLLLLVVSLFNMVPGPPGYGGTIAWTTILVAIAMLLGRPIRLPPIIGNRKLRLNLLLKASEQVVRVTAILARFSRPRLRWMTSGAANLPYAIFVILMGLVMIIPVPLINAIPNVGLCIIAFSMLNRDGIGVIIGVLASLVGLAIAGAIILGAFHLGTMALGGLP